MLIYLVRHGDAEDPSIDPLRPLSTLGREQAAKIGQFMAQNGVHPSAIWHSDKLRAQETTEIISKCIGCENRIRQINGMGPMDPINPIEGQILEEHRDVMLVGHLPFIGNLLSRLMTGNDDALLTQFDTASAACVLLEYGRASLLWFVGPSQL